MKTPIQKETFLKLECILILFFLVNVIIINALAEIIPPQRKVTWQGNVGVSGDIPTNYTKYGSTLTPTGGDDTGMIQTSLDAASAGQYVLLGSGIFQVTGSITIPDNVILRGSGINVTILEQQSSTSGATIVFNNNLSWTGSAYDLASGYTKGSTSIITSSTHDWSAGDVILIDQINPGADNDPPITNQGSQPNPCTWCGRDNGTRSMGQVVELASASGTSATLEIPLYYTFEAGNTPQGIKLTGAKKWAGLEELTIDNSNTMNDNQGEQGTINMAGVVNCWVLNVEVYGAKRMGIDLARAYRCTIRGVEIHKTLYYTSNNGYAIWSRYGVSACIIENCIFHDLSSGPIHSTPSSGNVIAYNYTTNIQSTSYTNAVRYGIGFHGAHQVMTLIEGNYFDGQFIAGDAYWGTSSNITIFRNRILWDTTKTYQVASIIFSHGHWYYNYVGNVLGNEQDTHYLCDEIPGTSSGPCVYVMEWDETDNTWESALVHGNFDYVNDGVVWDDEIEDHDLPNSYYLTEKPSWWGNLPWPAIGPDLIPMDGIIPARNRYLTPRSPKNLRVVK